MSAELDEALHHVSSVHDESVREQRYSAASVGRSLLLLIIAFDRFCDWENTPYKQLSSSITALHRSFSVKFYSTHLRDLVYFGDSVLKNTQPSGIIYQDVICAVVYAIWRAVGFSRTHEIIKPFLDSEPEQEQLDYKTLLQEYVQARARQRPVYSILAEHGPEHSKVFEVEVHALGRSVSAQGASKRKAEMEAARRYLASVGTTTVSGTGCDERSYLRSGKAWHVSSERSNEMMGVLRAFGVSARQLPPHYLDACFTHRSFFNKRSTAGDSYESLSLLGAYALDFVTSVLLLEAGVDHASLAAKRGEIVSQRMIVPLVDDSWLDKVRCADITVLKRSDRVKHELFQSVVGAFFLYEYGTCSYEPFSLIKDLIFTRLMPQVPPDSTDFTTQLNSICSGLGLGAVLKVEHVQGPAHSPAYTMSAKLLDLNDMQVSFVGEGTARTKREASRIAAGEVIRQLKNSFLDPDSRLPKRDSWNQLIASIVNAATKRRRFQSLGLSILGLSRTEWQPDSVGRMLELLCSRVLYSELQCMYALLCSAFSPELVNSVIANLGARSEILEIVRFSSVGIENGVVEPQSIHDRELGNPDEAPREVSGQDAGRSLDPRHSFLTFLYQLDDNVCPFCQASLKEVVRHVQTIVDGVSTYASIRARACLECRISGIDSAQIANLQANGLEGMRLFLGTPMSFQSTVLIKTVSERLVMSIHLDQSAVKVPISVRRSRRKQSPETLARRLEASKVSGDLGERIVLAAEKAFLLEAGRGDLADLVHWTAAEDTNAGYDILSFLPDGDSRYLEVKSTTGPSPVFYLSDNELRTAEEYGNRYVICRVNYVTSTPRITKYPNLAEKVSKKELLLRPTSFLVFPGERGDEPRE